MNLQEMEAFDYEINGDDAYAEQRREADEDNAREALMASDDVRLEWEAMTVEDRMAVAEQWLEMPF